MQANMGVGKRSGENLRDSKKSLNEKEQKIENGFWDAVKTFC